MPDPLYDPDADDDFAEADVLHPAFNPDLHLSQDEFFEHIFCSIFKASSMASGLNSLAVEPNEAGARESSNMLWEFAIESQAFQFLVNRKSKWIEKGLMVGIFVNGKINAVALEIRGRQAAAKDAQNQAA